MPLNYGILKGSIAGHLRDADDDHYQILVRTGSTVWRIASNVKSSAPKAPSTVLFHSSTALPDNFKAALEALAPGFKKVPSKPGGIAIDYLRGGLVSTKSMKPVPPDKPGADNDLKDMLESAVLKALEEEGSVIYAFGARWGPEPGKADKYFKFVPGNGIHDIHMNQGNSGKYRKDNGVYQDGALVFQYPGNKWRGFFFAFQSQSFTTDDATGHPVEGGDGGAKGALNKVSAKSMTKSAKKPVRKAMKKALKKSYK
jgi:uncharacterized protein YukJ